MDSDDDDEEENFKDVPDEDDENDVVKDKDEDQTESKEDESTEEKKPDINQLGGVKSSWVHKTISNRGIYRQYPGFSPRIFLRSTFLRTLVQVTYHIKGVRTTLEQRHQHYRHVGSWVGSVYSSN